MPRAALAAVPLAALALCLPLAAQQPDDFARLRDDHERALATATRMVDDVHRLTLRQLEKQRAEAADYEGAQRVKDKLDALDKRRGATVLIAKPVTYTLTVARSQTRDGANTDSSRQHIEFNKTGGKAIWTILPIEPGPYEVFLTYSVGLPVFNPDEVRDAADPAIAPPGGVVAFSEVTGFAASGANVLDKKVMTTGHWENFIRESLGRYDCRSRSVTVRVEAAIASASGLMHLRQVELVRLSGAAVPPVQAAAKPGQALKDMRRSHREAMAAASGGVQAKFDAEFRELEQQLSTSGDRIGAAAVARARRDLFHEESQRKPEDTQ